MSTLDNDDYTGGQLKDELLPSGQKGHSHKAHQLSLIITALSNFSVQYNFQAIAVALMVMSASVCTNNDDECKENEQASWVSGAATSTVFIGCIAGQLSMGIIGDIVGRNIAMCITLSIAALGALGSALCSYGKPEEIYIMIITCRFILGIGAGGVYPLSATKAAEDASKGGPSSGKVNPVAAGKAFFWQAPGAMTPWVVGYILSYWDTSAEAKWRLLLGLGFLPASLVVVLTVMEMRLRDNETKSAMREESNSLFHDTERDVDNTLAEGTVNAQTAIAEAAQRRKDEMLSDPHYRMQLLVTSGCWFIYDVAFYGVALFGGDIVNAMKTSDDDNVSSDPAIRYAASQEMLALAMGIPASIMTIYWMKTFGSKNAQVYGFIFQGVCFFMLSVAFYPLMKSQPGVLLGLYCLLLFSLNSGPSMTTFCLPAETFPMEIRTTFNGISAASGKLGAAVGAYMFGPVAAATSFPSVMILCGALCLLGSLISYMYIEDQDINAGTGTGAGAGGYQQLERTVREDEDDEDLMRVRYLSR